MSITAIAYAASLGGMATLTGTGANLVLQGTMNSMFGPNVGISFLEWLLLAAPIAWINLFLLWIILCVMYLTSPKKSIWCCGRMPWTVTSPSGRNIEPPTFNALNNSSSPNGANGDAGVVDHDGDDIEFDNESPRPRGRLKQMGHNQSLANSSPQSWIPPEGDDNNNNDTNIPAAGSANDSDTKLSFAAWVVVSVI